MAASSRVAKASYQKRLRASLCSTIYAITPSTGLAFCMVKNASIHPSTTNFRNCLSRAVHPGLMKRFGEAMGLTDQDLKTRS
jgi:hypothetical protein